MRNILSHRRQIEFDIANRAVPDTRKKVVSELPRSRSSRDHFPNGGYLSMLRQDVKLVNREYNELVVPLIRKLAKTNEDLGLALHDAVALSNSGFSIKFDSSVKPEQADKMIKHLNKRAKEWGYGVAGLNGLVDKLIAQLYISGSVAGEWVPDKQLTKISECVLVHPETIHFSYSRRKWKPYQKVKPDPLRANEDVRKLNEYTFRYIGFGGDTSDPYGIPPFITSLEAIADQKDFKRNIRTVSKLAGLLGHLQLLIDKPSQVEGESDSKYKSRLEALLDESYNNLKDGLNDGVSVGFMDDHEINFHQTTKSAEGLDTIYQNNETQIANGLKMPAQFLGVNKAGGSESGLSVIFTKILSQLNRTHDILNEFLSYGFALELRLAGYNFEEINLEFNRSTITDDLKTQQANEIKQRVAHNLVIDGIISQAEYAKWFSYDKPFQDEPLVPYDKQLSPGGSDDPDDPEGKKRREEKKDESDRRSRDKKKSQPKRKDGDTRKR